MAEHERKDPLQRAVERVENNIQSPRYNRSALQRALDNLAATGWGHSENPGELLATLASYAGRLAEKAQQFGKAEDALIFTEQQNGFQLTGERFTQVSLSSTSPSRPGRTTGIAAG